MKKKIVFIMMLFMALTGSYTSETNAASNPEKERPTFLKNPRDEIVLEGFNVKITAVVTGKPFPSVHFYRDKEIIKNDARHVITTNSDTGEVTLTILNTKLKDDGKYTISAQNDAGRTTASCQLIVLEFDDGL